MRQLLRTLAWMGLGLLAGLPGCGGQDSARQPAASADRSVLAVSVFPVADLAQRVAGDRWEVATLLPPGRTPHDFALRPAEAARLVRAKALVAVGGGLDDWAVRAARGVNPRAHVLVLMEALDLAGPAEGPVEAPGHEEPNGEHEGQAHRGRDPHIWLDPVLAGRIVERLAEQLEALDPAGRDEYQRNLAQVQEQLRQLDGEYRAALADCATRTLVVFHPGYGYLARRYGLEQVAVSGMGGTSPGAVEQVIGRIRAERIPAVFREPQFESKWVDLVSRRSGAKVLVLDPLGQAGVAGHDSYFAMMRGNLAALREGLCGGA